MIGHIRWYAALPLYVLFGFLMGCMVLLGFWLEVCASAMDALGWQWQTGHGRPR